DDRAIANEPVRKPDRNENHGDDSDDDEDTARRVRRRGIRRRASPAKDARPVRAGRESVHIASHAVIVARIARAREHAYSPIVPKTIRVAVGEETTTATSYAAKSARATLVLAHGAGAGQKHPFLVWFAKAISARGIDVVTFDFLYMARKKKMPDRADALEACW